MINLGFEAFLLFFCCSMLVASFVIYLLLQTLFNQPPFVPSRLKNIKLAFDYIELNSDSRFIDLGAGDGRVVFTAAKKRAQSTGIEINPYLVIYCRLISFLKGSTAKFIRGSYFRHNLEQYNVVFTYLYPEVVEKLEEKIFRELPSGSWIITNTFNFPSHTPVQQFDNVYVYQKT